jgi:hypothetical protein
MENRMDKYKNLGLNSNVLYYQIGEDYIVIKFRDTARTYTYSYRKAGRANVEEMKRLALLGIGLNAYINQHVRNLYN